jgi:hypothetical protein
MPGTESLRLRARAGRALALLACLSVGAGCGAAGQPGGQRAGHAGASPAGTTSAPAKPSGTAGTGNFVKHADLLSAISCSSARSCVAVGSYYDVAAGPTRPLVERWNGTSWRVEPLPADGRIGALSGISCPSPDNCTAVGSLILGWNGSRWQVERKSSPFESVSCAARSSCVAVGVTRSGAPVAGTWNGSAWHLAAMPTARLGAHSTTLASLSCATPTRCLAVGDYTSGASARPSPQYRDRTLVERWDGMTWQVLPAVDVARRDKLSGISCSAPRQCMAVGSARAKTTLAERWDGTSWSAQRTPNLDPVGYSELTSVSCPSPAECMAIGDYNLSVPFAERYHGGRWTMIRMPVPAGQAAVSGLALSCSIRECVMAGSDAGRALTELWNGSMWRILATPSPR